MSNITDKINELVDIQAQMEKLKLKRDIIEADILKQCEQDLSNTKYKTKVYEGDNSRLTATNTESLKVVYGSFLPFIFNISYKDAVTEKITYNLSAAAKRMIIGIWKGNYLKSTIADVIGQMPITESDKKQLIKKLKGINYDKDVQNILKFTPLSEADAKEYAYLVSEAAVWQDFTNFLKINSFTKKEQIDDVLQKNSICFCS